MERKKQRFVQAAAEEGRSRRQAAEAWFSIHPPSPTTTAILYTFTANFMAEC